MEGRANEVVSQTGGGPNGAAIGPDGRCYICNNGGFTRTRSGDMLIPLPPPDDTAPGFIQVVDMATGKADVLYPHTPETPMWGPNDIVFDAHGGFWFTDYGRTRGRWHSEGSIYYAKADGSGIQEKVRGLDRPNGIGLSPDGKTLYVALTMEGHLRAFDVAAPGELITGSSFFDTGRMLGRARKGEFLDSLAVDSRGNICVASPGAGAVLVFSPEGEVIRRIETGDPLTTNICFGGKDLRSAYITLGATGKLVEVEWDCPGLELANPF